MHGSVCRTAVQVQRQAPDVVLRGLDEQGRVVSQRDVALYGRTNDRVGGCAYFNALVQVVDGARAEICLMDGEQARQCVAAPPG